MEHFTGNVRVDTLFQPAPPSRVAPASWGGPIEEIRQGDVVSVGPNEKHWHGASPTTAMTEWLEKVTDSQYEGGKP